MPQVEYTNTSQRKSNPFTSQSGSAAVSVRQAESVISVYCEVCSARAKGTRSSLKRKGWGLYRRDEFCPVHESEN